MSTATIDNIEDYIIKNEHYVPSPRRMREVFLPKRLQKLCGGRKSVKLMAANFAHIVSYLEVMFGVAVKQEILKNNWYIRFGSDKDNFVDQTTVHNLGEYDEIHMYFKVTGAGRAAQFVVGAILTVVGVMISPAMPMIGSALINMGIGLMLMALLSPKAASQRAKDDERASFLFDTPTNVTEQGCAVPLAYGRSMVGSVVLTVGIDTEQIQTYNSPLGGNFAPDSAFGIRDIF